MGRKPSNETHDEWHANLKVRFLKYCSPGHADACWKWTGSVQKQGYGMLSLGTHHNGLSRGAHVAAYIIYRDPHFREYDSTSLHHTCLNEWCANPNHLELLSHYENNLRKGHLAPGVIDTLIHEFPEASRPLSEARSIILTKLGVPLAENPDMNTSLRGVADLPPEVFLAVVSAGEMAELYFADAAGTRRSVPPIATLSFRQQVDWNCGVVIYSEASSGFGPLLYVSAIAIATRQFGGLLPDRGEVSSEARALWDRISYFDDRVTSAPIGPPIPRHNDSTLDEIYRAPASVLEAWNGRLLEL